MTPLGCVLRLTSGHSPVRVVLALVLGGVCVQTCAGSDELQPLNVRPDRGNNEAHAYPTGPASSIQRFYNDDLEISFWRGPSPLVFNLAKNDVWDRRYFGDQKRIVDIDAIREMCFGGQIPPQNGPFPADSPQALYLAYDYPCPKPVGQVIIRCPDLVGAEWSAGRARDGSLVTRSGKGETQASVSAFLCRRRNVFVIEGRYTQATQPVQVELYRHQDTTPQGTSVTGIAHYGGDTQYDYTQDVDNGPLPHPESGHDGRFFWIRQRFPADKTFPDGFESVLMGQVEGARAVLRADAEADGGVKAVIHPLDDAGLRTLPGYKKELRVATERFNNADPGSRATATLQGPDPSFSLLLAVVTTRDANDPVAAAKRLLTQARREGSESLRLRNITATDDAIREWRNSRVMHYNATSCSYLDFTPWHGDYHFNEGYHTHEIVAGRADGLEQRLRMFEEMLPALKRNAREVYHCGGAAFSLVHYPIRSDRVVYSNFTWEWGIENTAFMLQPFWQVYQYTQDIEFLRERAYPMMVEGARFYADYAAKGDDGLYHVIPTVSQEHWGFTPEYKLNRDSVGALSFVKYHLKACIEASEVLGIDNEERANWRDIVENLAPYPTLETPEGPVFCDVRDAPQILNYNITANLVNVLWAEDISLDSPPELLEIARRSYEALPDKEHSMRPGYLSQIRLFLGMPEHVDLSPQGQVLSWPGRIHIYAGVPEGEAANDSFTGLLAIGGFEVSARRIGTDVCDVRVTSRAGRTCRVKTPWPGLEAKVMDFAGRTVVPHTMDGDTIVFDTDPGHEYALLAGPELALARAKFAPNEKTVGAWRFGRQGLRDTSGDGHDARLVGNAQLDSGLELDGEGSYAEIDRAPAFDFAANESFTVEARIRFPATTPPAMAPIVCSMALKQYCLMLSDGRAHFYLSSPKGDVFAQATGKTVLTDGDWHTVRGVRDVATDTARVYVDGKLEGSASDTTSGDFACTSPITIGAYLWGENSRYSQGIIDDVEIRSLGKLVKRD